MASAQPFAAVLRLEGVAASQAQLETVLGTKLDRYEPFRQASSNYAQADMPVEIGDCWQAIETYVRAVGPRIAALRQQHEIRAAIIDLAVSFDARSATLSVRLPSHLAETIGRHGVDVEISVYLTSDDV